MNVIHTALPEIVIFEPKKFGDARGFFLEHYQAERYQRFGVGGPFVQDNLSRSARGVVRGLHLQNPSAQGKLVSVMRGSVIDVAVDVRIGSPTFGKHVAVELSDQNFRQLWVPRGFATGYYTLEDFTTVLYSSDNDYHPEAEMGIRWNDPCLKNISLPPYQALAISEKDQAWPDLIS